MTTAHPPDDRDARETPDVWADLRRSTRARIGLGRAGNSLPSRRVLEFQAAHAAARDAVHDPLDAEAFADSLAELGIGTPIVVTSRASTRSEYLRRPDLGREPETLTDIPRADAEIGIVVADGLSPRAVAAHGRGLVAALLEVFDGRYSVAPPVVATQARVALGDHIGEALGVTTLIVIIGERPGLSVADSLGIYLTHLPRPGRTDADRNCVSNIHPPDGLTYDAAARTTAALVEGARKLGRSGVALKDMSRQALENFDAAAVESSQA